MLSLEEARQLERVAFAASAAAPAAAAAGSRAAKVRGAGSEFHDFRHYQPGDDPRRVEWTIYGRLGQLVTRTYRAEAHVRVHLLVDVSRSMTLGAPDKLACARKLAALLGYVAVRDGHAVGLTTFDDSIVQRVAPATGRPQLLRLLAALDETAARGVSSIGRVLVDYGAVERGPGLVVVISDCLDPSDLIRGLRFLRHRGLTPGLVQVLSPDEIDPPIADETELVDIEDDAAAPLAIDPAAVAAYRQALASLRASLGEFCATHALPWIQVQSSDSFVEWLRACQRAGVVASRG